MASSGNTLYVKNIIDYTNNSKGSAGQVLSSTGSAVEWITTSSFAPNLQAVTDVGNVTTNTVSLQNATTQLEIGTWMDTQTIAPNTVTTTSGFSNPIIGVSSDGTYVWLANSASPNTVNRITIADSSVITISGIPSPQGISSNGTYVWVISSSTLYRITIADSSVTTIPLINAPSAVSSDGTYVWVTTGIVLEVYRITIADSSVTTILLTSETDQISSDGTYVWVVNSSASTVSRITIADSSVITIPGITSFPGGISSDGTYVWVTSYTASTVYRITIADSSVITIPGITNPSGGISSDGTYVWVTTGPTLVVFRITIADSSVITITVGSGPPDQISSDGTYVWATYYPGVVYRINILNNLINITDGVIVQTSLEGVPNQLGKTRFTQEVLDSNNSKGVSGQVLSSTGTAVEWITLSQPMLQSGSLSTPNGISSILSLTYVANITKYVLYVSAAATTVALNQTFQVLNCPVNFLAYTTISGSADWVLTGLPPLATVFPVFTQSIGVLNDTNGLTTLSLQVLSSTAASFSSGAPCLKIVINLTND